MFQLIGKLASEGRGIVVISSYLPELVNMCDRILVIRDGAVAGELEREDFSDERIVALATGGEQAHETGGPQSGDRAPTAREEAE